MGTHLDEVQIDLDEKTLEVETLSKELTEKRSEIAEARELIASTEAKLATQLSASASAPASSGPDSPAPPPLPPLPQAMQREFAAEEERNAEDASRIAILQSMFNGQAADTAAEHTKELAASNAAHLDELAEIRSELARALEASAEAKLRGTSDFASFRAEVESETKKGIASEVAAVTMVHAATSSELEAQLASATAEHEALRTQFDETVKSQQTALATQKILMEKRTAKQVSVIKVWAKSKCSTLTETIATAHAELVREHALLEREQRKRTAVAEELKEAKATGASSLRHVEMVRRVLESARVR